MLRQGGQQDAAVGETAVERADADAGPAGEPRSATASRAASKILSRLRRASARIEPLSKWTTGFRLV
jgi:hypothetical protein